MAEKWSMKGSILGDCNCDWGCPCNFDVAPTDGHCDGVYIWVVDDGRYGDVDLAGAKFAMAASAPGPIHEGNLTSALMFDEAATAQQRDALQALWSGDAGLPFDILVSVTGTWLDPIDAPFEIELAGMNSKARIGGGEVYEVAFSRVKNPVTGEEEELYLDKPTGFTSRRSELGMTPVSRFSFDGLSYDNSGKYGEYSSFEYRSAG
jgi:hypothetical protein